MNKFGVRIIVSLTALLLFYILGIFVRGQYGIRMLISNQSGEILRRVKLNVEKIGPRYDLGDLANGVRKHIFVQPRADSHVSLEFLDARNMQHTEVVVGYVEAGYCGSVTATVQPGSIVRAAERIDLLFCKWSWLDFFR
jgi:hypothetical protein